MNKVIVSAPAKVILSGEHAVVYGRPAIACATQLRITCVVTHSNKIEIKKSLKPIYDLVLKTIKKEGHTIINEECSVKITSDIPVGRGLGSSGALSVVLSSALYTFLTEKIPDKEYINSLAYQVEKHFHGNPSGIDNSTSCFGGLIYFRKEFEFLKNISSLGFKIPNNIEQKLFLIDSGKSVESTLEMVQLVGRRYNEDPERMEKIMYSIEKFTKRLVISIVKEDVVLFESTLKDIQNKLEEMGVVSDKTKKIIQLLNTFGTGKVTGAGGVIDGSGFVLFFTTDQEGLIQFLNEQKIPYYQFKQDTRGVEIICE
ncbi:MAG: mevalonate kinase [Candidatus Roizmanbacteria bacterium]